MTIEQRMMQAIESAVTPYLAAAKKSFGYTEQDDEKFPTSLPLCIVQLVGMEPLTSMCGTDRDRCFKDMAVQHVARGAEEVKEQAQEARLMLLDMLWVDSLESETFEYDPDLRAWMVTQAFRCFETENTF